MTSAPPSLRVYMLSRRLPGLWSSTDVLEERGQLVVELMTYAAEETRVANEEAARARSTARSSSGSRVAGRGRRRR